MTPLIKRVLISTTAAIATATLIFSSFAQAANASDFSSASNVAATSVYQYGDGYYIQNDTNQVLTLASSVQNGNYSYTNEPTPYTGFGWRQNPPGQIQPGEKAYFEVRLNLPTTFPDGQSGLSADDTNLVYTVGDTARTVSFTANLGFTFTAGSSGTFSFTQPHDHSVCSVAEGDPSSCVTIASPGRGSQTTFIVNPIKDAPSSSIPNGASVTPQSVSSPAAQIPATSASTSDFTVEGVDEAGNGYYIQNNTNQTLKLASTNQPGDYSYTKSGWAKDNTYHGAGWFTDPPQEIKPGEKAYFEVRTNLPSFEFDGTVREGESTDNSQVVYTMGDTARTVTFEANLRLFFKSVEGGYEFYYFSNTYPDLSQCSVQGGSRDACITTPSEGQGTQTTFMVDGAF